QNDGNVVIYSASGQALWATGTAGQYPFWFTAPLLCNHTFRIDSSTMAWDPTALIEVSRSYTFGYWSGHCVYKMDAAGTTGIDINTLELIVLQPYHSLGVHWDVVGVAGTST